MTAALHVLQIEDSPTVVQLTRLMLAESNSLEFTIDDVDTLAAGIKRLSRGGIDVVLLDLTLPDSEGIDTFRVLHAAVPRVPVVIYTSVDDEAATLDALHQGAADYLVKSEVHAKWLIRALSYMPKRNRQAKSDEKSGKASQESRERTIEIEKSESSPGLFLVRINERRMVSVVTMETVKNRLQNLVRRVDATEVRIDFSNVEYVSNVAISMLLIVHKKAKTVDTALVLCNVSPSVYDQFSSRRFDKVFHIEKAIAGD